MFYDRFLSLCDEKGVKPTPLIVSFGLSSSNASQWRKGSVPRPAVLARLAEYFDVSVEYLLEKTDEKKPVATPGNGHSDEANQLLDDIKDFPPEDVRKVREYAQFVKSQRNPE